MRAARKQTGAAVLLIVACLFLIVIPLIGIFAFEIGRANLASQQMKHVCDSAALTVTTTLSMQASTADPITAQSNAIAAAMELIKKNSVLGASLQNSNQATSINSNPSPSKGLFYFQFIDPLNRAVVPFGDARAKMVKVYGKFGCPAAFENFLSIKPFTISSASTSAIPKLDLLLCFDVSGSMDDQTHVTMVNRYWDNDLHKIVYSVPSGQYGPANGVLFDVLQPSPTGSNVNVMQPQCLDLAYASANLNFSEYLCQSYGVQPLRSLGGYPDQGKAPGNFPPGQTYTFLEQNAFTDLVCNLDGAKTFSGFNYAGYSFPDIATLVEASRGNLENDAVFASSKANTSVLVKPRQGYQKAYEQACQMVIQPLRDSKEAAKSFIQSLGKNTDCRFGMLSFDDNIGTAPDSTVNWINIDQDTNYGVNAPFAHPAVPLNISSSSAGSTQVSQALDSCRALGATNIGKAVDAAVHELKANGRPGAVKAIVVFSDGQPTSPGGPLSDDPLANARLSAVEAGNTGLAVYTVGLAMNPTVANGQNLILNDSNKDPLTGGMAAIAGNGGTYVQVTDSKQLQLAFEKTARNLVRLVATNGGGM